MTAQAPRAPQVLVVAEESIPIVVLGGRGTQAVLLGAERGDGSPLLLGITKVFPGCTTDLIRHETAEIAYVLEGFGAIVMDEGSASFSPGSAILIEAGCWHAIRADEEQVSMIFSFPSAEAPRTERWNS
jgi:mannose-6-phosphate isomerase-like protein (cupin superfamily)